jgi:hypothetical protein
MVRGRGSAFAYVDNCLCQGALMFAGSYVGVEVEEVVHMRLVQEFSSRCEQRYHMIV